MNIPNSDLTSIIAHNTALCLLVRLNWGEFLYQLLSSRKQGKARISKNKTRKYFRPFEYSKDLKNI